MIKKTLGLFLVLTTLFSISSYSCNKPSPPPVAATPNTPTQQNTPAENNPATPQPTVNRVDVVYFHTKIRCASCLYIEIRTKHNIDTHFSQELASGKLTFNIYDLGNKDNAAIAKLYGTIGSELFFNTVKGSSNHIKKILEVWDNKLLNDQPAFDEFIQKLIKKSLEEIA